MLIVCEVIIDRLLVKGPRKCFKGVRRHAQGSKQAEDRKQENNLALPHG